MKNEISGEAIRALIHSAHLHRSVLDQARSRVGLHSRSQHWALLYMEERGGLLSSQKELADFLEISPAAVAVMLKSLQNAGYVEKAASSEDGRSKVVRLTDLGREALLRTRCYFDELDVAMLEGLDEQTLKQLIACHRKMQENLRRLDGESETHKLLNRTEEEGNT